MPIKSLFFSLSHTRIFLRIASGLHAWGATHRAVKVATPGASSVALGETRSCQGVGSGPSQSVKENICRRAVTIEVDQCHLRHGLHVVPKMHLTSSKCHNCTCKRSPVALINTKSCGCGDVNSPTRQSCSACTLRSCWNFFPHGSKLKRLPTKSVESHIHLS